ncbi:MAG: hypothetical protein D6798_19235, partial [Deltaproteobacteria bacterium]
SLSELQRAVPIRSHAELLPWLDRVAAGERGVLSSEPVPMLVETSGTTGRPKLLPVTPSWSRSVARAQELWLLGLLREHPEVSRGRALAIVGSARHGRSAGGLRVGSNTGRMRDAQPWFLRARYAVPPEVADLRPYDLKLYVLLRLALVQPVTSLTTANPSTVLVLIRKLEAWRAELEADLAANTVRRGPAEDLDPRLRRRFERRLALRPRRRRLPPAGSSLAAIWPLRVVNCWTAGPAAFFADRLAAALGPRVPVRPVGVTGSEGYFAVPLAGDWPGGVLHTGGHLLELVDDRGEARPAWEAEEGERLRLVITTEAGLVRYDLGDIVEVVGRCEQTPVVRFVGKAGRFLDVAGERVSEAQVSEAALRASAALGRSPTGFTVRARRAELPWHEVAIEGLSEPAARRWLARYDEALAGLNMEYANKRRTERLGPPALRLLGPGTYGRWRAARVAAGAPAGQVKDPLLAVDDDEWRAVVGDAAAGDAAGREAVAGET